MSHLIPKKFFNGRIMLELLDDLTYCLGALEMTGLETLADRRVKRCLNFSLKAIRHERNTKMFPLNKTAGIFNTRHSEIFSVNFAATTAYRESAIPFCQRLLNKDFKNK